MIAGGMQVILSRPADTRAVYVIGIDPAGAQYNCLPKVLSGSPDHGAEFRQQFSSPLPYRRIRSHALIPYWDAPIRPD
jgi:hypothetical protein